MPRIERTSTAGLSLPAEENGGLAAFLLFLALAFAAAGSAQAVVGLWAAAALVLAALLWRGRAAAPRATWLTLSAAAFAALIAANDLFLSPAYTPAGLFHPLLFILAFAAVRRCRDGLQRALLRGALAAAALLAAWGVVQVGLFGQARALAFLETPNTFAALIKIGREHL